MVVFDPAKATASLGLPIGKQELQVKEATFGTSKTGKPMVTIELVNSQGITGKFYLVPTQFSDNTIQRLLGSAQSCGTQIPAGYDFQVNANLAGFIKARVKSFYVNVVEEAGSDYPNIKSFLVKPAQQAPAPDDFNPFDQQTPPDPFAQPQGQADLFGQTPQADPFGGQPATPQQQQYNPFGRDPQSDIDSLMNQAYAGQGQPQVPPVGAVIPAGQVTTGQPLPPVNTPPVPNMDIPQATLDNLPFDTQGLQGTGGASQPAQDWSN